MVIDSEPITMQQATLLHDLAADRAVELDPSTIEHALSSRAAHGMDPQLDRERRELLQAREQIDRRLAQLDQLLEPRYPASWSSLDREQARSVIDWLKRQPVPDLQSRVALAITAGPGDQTEPILLDVTCGYCGAAAGTPCFTKFGEVRWDNPHKPRIELADAEQLVEHARERRRQARAAADAGGDEDWSKRTEMAVPAPVNGRLHHTCGHRPRWQGRRMSEVANSLGCSIYALRTWVQKADVESGAAEPPPSSRERDEIRQLKRELLTRKSGYARDCPSLE
ncbi:MAG: transposase [Gaiellales bacterium]